MTRLPPPNQNMPRHPNGGTWIYAALLLMAAAVLVATILKGNK